MLKQRWVVGPHLGDAPYLHRYALALAVFGLTLLIRWQLRPLLGDESPLLAFVFPVLLTAFLCGPGPAIFLTLLAPVVCTAVFHTQFSWSDPLGWLAHIGFFAFVCVVAVVLIDQLQGAYRRLIRSMEGERQGRERDSLLRSIVDSSGDAIISEDLDHRVMTWNAAAERLFGYSAREIVGQPTSMLAMPRSTLADLAEGMSAVIHHVQRVRKDGTTFHAAETQSQVTDANGNRIGYCRTVRDISEMVRAQEDLAKSQLRFRQLADSMPQIVYVLDTKRNVTYLNKRWEEYTGHAEARQSDIEALIPAEDVQKLFAAWEENAAKRQPYSVEFRLRLRDGELRWFLRRAAPILAEDGSIEMWVGTSTDIHEQKLAQTALLDADRRKNEFLAMLAHELRNPLAPIMNIGAILEAKANDATAVHQMASIVKRQSTHLARLIDDLLDVSRITRGKINLERERVVLQDVLDRALETVHPMLIAKSQAVKLEVPPRAAAVDGDIVRLTQVVGNLLANAAKFSPRASTIFLTLDADAQHAFIKIRDQGIGIDAQMLPHIFELFMQADQSLDRSQGGLGIGLTIAQQLVQLHGGKLSAFSEGLGKGSEFVICLPLAEVMNAKHELSPNKNETRKRILIVDDNKDAAMSLLMLLELEGHEVVTTHDATSTLKLLAETTMDVVFLDIGLPELDGSALAELIRDKSGAQAPRLVALSGYGPEETSRPDSRFGAHLTKPVQHQLLIKTVTALFDRSVS
ncbi:MAG TPA: PAS domain S-box protein [Steroidobacteraceae bacterium]|nr:PAS domain S-box protein [Steroidobacteraceae bacterium]